MPTNPIYQYTWKTGWNTSGSVKAWPSIDQQKADLIAGLKKATLEQMAAKFAEVGHWLKVDSISVDINQYTTHWNFTIIEFEAQGVTTVVFESDATLNQEFSPQGWEEFLIGLGAAIVLACMAHPIMFFVLLVIVALTIFALAGGFKGVLFGSGNPSPLADIGTTIIIVTVLALGTYAAVKYFGGKNDRNRRRRG